MRLREKIKRALPKFMLGPLQELRNQLARSPLEELVLHDYTLAADPGTKPRFNLLIPSIAPEKTFGGILTGIDIFLEIGKRAGADLRIILDEIGPVPAGNSVADRRPQTGHRSRADRDRSAAEVETPDHPGARQRRLHGL